MLGWSRGKSGGLVGELAWQVLRPSVLSSGGLEGAYMPLSLHPVQPPDS